MVKIGNRIIEIGNRIIKIGNRIFEYCPIWRSIVRIQTYTLEVGAETKHARYKMTYENCGRTERRVVVVRFSCCPEDNTETVLFGA